MILAIRESEKARELDEVPVGAVIVRGNHIIGKGYNQCERLKDATAHAEVIAITSASNHLQDWHLEDCTLYVTKEPCAMCAGAILNSRIKQLVFGCYDEKEGCCGSLYQLCGDPRFLHRTSVNGGVLENECQSLLIDFFKSKRQP